MLRKEFTNPMNNSGMLKEAVNIARVELIDPSQPTTLSNVYVSNAGSAQVQRITAANANDNNRMSSRFVEDGSYLRIKNISLGYTFPKKWISKLNIDNLPGVYEYPECIHFTNVTKDMIPKWVLTIMNVLTRGIDNARYPSQRIYTFGLNLSF